jgi:hypothetical protein
MRRRQRVGACARLSFLVVNEEESRAGIGKCGGDGLTNLAFASHTSDYHILSGEIHLVLPHADATVTGLGFVA